MTMNVENYSGRVENRLLTMLRPGEMLRFVFDRAVHGKFAAGLEGNGPDPVALMERIAAILDASRAEGYSFRNDAGLDDTVALSDGAEGVVIDVRPIPHMVQRLSRTRMGFTATQDPEADHGPDLLPIPDFPASDGPLLADHPVLLLSEVPSVRRLEIEFSRIDLPESTVGLVAHALGDELELKRAIRGADFPATPTIAFLGLWWSRRCGWRVGCRVFLDPSADVPTGALQMLGRELFGAECTLEAFRNETSAVAAPTSLVQAYPDGWRFPPILPPSERSGMLVAERIHNRRLPVLPEEGMLIGIADGKEVRLPEVTRDRHVYIVGATGTGKTTLLSRLIRDDLRRNEGLVLLDPHGDLYHEILSAVPKKRRASVVMIDPTSGKGAIPFNILDFPRDRFVRRRAEFLIGELIQFFRHTWDANPEALGPMFELYFRNALRLLIHQPDEIYTLAHFQRVFADREFRKQLLASCADESVKQFWCEVADKVSGEASLANVTPYITSKVSVLTQSGFLAEMINQPKDELLLEDRINCGGIVLVNLNKGLLGAHESRFLGVLLTMQVFAAGLKRSLLPPAERCPVNVHIDEFQNFVSDNVASMLSEARKFGLRLSLANQTLSQLNAGHGRQDLLETVLGNVGNMIAFRLGVPDAERLRPFLKPFTPEQMQDLPNFHALVRLLDGEGPVGPLVMRTFKP